MTRRERQCPALGHGAKTAELHAFIARPYTAAACGRCVALPTRLADTSLKVSSRRLSISFSNLGLGRELGHWGVEEYLETKQVYVNLDEKPVGWY